MGEQGERMGGTAIVDCNVGNHQDEIEVLEGMLRGNSPLMAVDCHCCIVRLSGQMAAAARRGMKIHLGSQMMIVEMCSCGDGIHQMKLG